MFLSSIIQQVLLGQVGGVLHLPGDPPRGARLLNVVVANQLYSCQPVVTLHGGVVSQQSKNPTNQLGNQLLNGIVANQQKKPVINVQQLLVTQKPQVCETWSGFSNFYFC